ncbi:MAG TPA: YdcF family protein [Kofleriaceae bacterium]|nr:YdcF family protein [Kofleriaceae bacterium]
MIVRALARALETPLAISTQPVEPLDAIVVLGAPLARDGSLTQVLAERVAATVALYRAGGAPIVVASGGTTHGAPRAEADALAEALRDAGVSDVIVERDSKTTVENARFTAEMLAARGARRVWLVTQPFHGKRAALLFRRAGLEPVIWHIDDSVQYRDRRRALRWLVREWASWGVLLLRGR